MNLKEAFRYQKFLDSMMDSATYSIVDREHSLKTTKRHLMNAANPDAVDKTEEVVPDRPFAKNDDVMRFMKRLVSEKTYLSTAIGAAKNSAGFDIDAAIEANKFRQRASAAIKRMMQHKGGRKVERGQSWKFNNEGVQSAYYYDVEVETVDNFDRENAKKLMRDLMQEADRVSAMIDAALINCQVDYKPPYDVNESFEDAITEFLTA